MEQPDSNENGLVVVNFYPEKDRPEVKIVEHHDYKHYCHHHHYGHCMQCCNDWYCPICHPMNHWPWRHPWHDDVWCGGLSSSGNNITYGSATDTFGKGMSSGGTMMNSTSMGGVQANNQLSADTGEDAATVEGSKSYQRFVTGHIDADYDHPIVLQIKLKGVSKIIDQCPCGHKRDSDERYCPKCGNVLAVGVAA